MSISKSSADTPGSPSRQLPGPLPAPTDFNELLRRLEALRSRTLADLAAEAGIALPASPLHGKGFAGALIEQLLGATARNRPEPDFPELALELKTIPVGADLLPLESTFICHAPVDNLRGESFPTSALYHKIRRVLIVLIRAERSLPLPDRYVAGFAFWEPDAAEMATIRADYEELMELVALGRVQEITARLGTIIQMRPKAASGRILTRARDEEGLPIATRPRGFYMRRSFTRELVIRLFGLKSSDN